MCGDNDPCYETTDTCVNIKGGEIYDAICKCGKHQTCSLDEICEKGKCKAIEKNHTDTISSIEDSIEKGKSCSISKVVGK